MACSRASRSRTTLLAFHDAATLPAGVIGVTPGYVLANVDTVEYLGEGRWRAWRLSAKRPRIRSSSHRGSSRRCRPWSAARTIRQHPAVVTVGSFHSGTKNNIISDEAKLALTVRSYTPEIRKLLLDGIDRIVRGEAIAAGMPDDRMPVVEIEQPSADATFNTA